MHHLSVHSSTFDELNYQQDDELLLLKAVGKLGFTMCICFAIADIVSQFGPIENHKLWKREGFLVTLLEKYEILV